MRRLLDPTLDVVFKLLPTSTPESPRVLRSLLTAVLKPSSPIAKVTVINPEIPRDAVQDKGIVLDLLVELENRTRLDVEMQADKRGAFRNRALYYWARAFSGQMERGDGYQTLMPVISVLFLDYSEIDARRLHSIFQLLEIHDHARFTDAIELHVIELPELTRLDAAELAHEAALVRWSRFFAATTDAEIEELAMNDPTIGEAHTALERLSADPAARALARDREMAMATYRIEMAAAISEGEAKGKAEGKAEGLRVAIDSLCEVLGIALDQTRAAELASCSPSELEVLIARLKRLKRWPDRHDA